MKRTWWFIIGAFFFGALFWMIDSILDYVFLYNNMSFADIALFDVPSREIYARIAVFVLFIMFGLLMARSRARRNDMKRGDEYEDEVRSRTFDSLGEAVSVHADDFTVINANRSMCELLGKTRTDIIGKKCYQLFHGTKHPIDACPCQLTRESKRREVSDFREPALKKWIEVSTTPILDTRDQIFAFVHMIRDVTSEREQDAVLNNKLSCYETVLNNAREAIIVEQDDRLVFASKPMERITGYTCDELMATPFVEYIHPDDRSIVLGRRVKRMREGGAMEVYPFRTIRKDGVERWLEVNVSDVEWEGRPASIAVVEDVTQRMQKQSKLHEGVTKYTQLLSNMASGVIVYDVINEGEDFLVKEINDAAERIENVERESVVGTNARMSFPYVEGSELAAIYRDVWKTGRPRQRSREIIMADGSKGWREHFVQRLQTGELADVFEDVTEQRRAEHAREETESRYRTVVDNATEAIFIARDGMFKITNPKVREITGYTSEELANRNFVEFVHPDDQASVVENYERLLRGEKPQSQTPFRLIHKSGRVRWVQINAVRIAWDEKPASLNFLIDVTDRRRAEEELRESEERFRTLNEASFEGVVIHENGVITDINAPAVKLLGYEWAEAKGVRLVDIVGPTYRHVIADIASGAFDVLREIEFVRGDGTRLLVEVRAKEMPCRGRTVGVVAMRDVSERKEAEGELRKRMQEIERLNEYMIGREMRIIEVKKEVNELLRETGRMPRYKV